MSGENGENGTQPPGRITITFTGEDSSEFQFAGEFVNPMQMLAAAKIMDLHAQAQAERAYVSGDGAPGIEPVGPEIQVVFAGFGLVRFRLVVWHVTPEQMLLCAAWLDWQAKVQLTQQMKVMAQERAHNEAVMADLRKKGFTH